MIENYREITPSIASSCFIAPSADIVGRITLKKDVSVWYNAVIRGDVNQVIIGEGSNIQDGAVIHEADAHPCVIGKNVTVGHNAIVHACTVEDNVLIGMGATILDGAHIEKNVIVGAGALVPPGKRIRSGSLVVGMPCMVMRQLTENEIINIQHSAKKYIALSKAYKKNR